MGALREGALVWPPFVRPPREMEWRAQLRSDSVRSSCRLESPGKSEG